MFNTNNTASERYTVYCIIQFYVQPCVAVFVPSRYLASLAVKSMRASLLWE